MVADFFQRFEERLRERPDAIAVCCGGESVSYAELERRAAVVGSGLRRGRVDEPSLVAVYLPSGIGAVAAILGVVGRGHGFLGIDSDRVAADVEATFEHCQPEVVVTDAAGRKRLPRGFRGEVLVVDGGGGGVVVAGVDGVEGGVWVDERHPFLCVFQTSGTTGKPKAIVQTHAVICADLERAVRDTGLGAGDRIDQRFSLSFSAFVSPLICALGTGAEMHLMPGGCESSAEQADWMGASGITYSTLTPLMWQHLCRGLGEGRKLEEVRFLGLSGDGFRERDIDLLKAHLLPGAVVQNAVASSEARTYLQSFSTVGEVTAARLLAVRPVPEKGVSVRGVGGAEVGVDGGEIVLETRLRSPGDWPGYRERAEALAGLGPFRTGDWAMPLEDGTVRFLGRRSDYVKIGGFRVSPKRTEAWLCEQPGIEDAVVEAVACGVGDEAVLVAFCGVEPGGMDEVRSRVEALARAELPGYQVPQRWEYRDVLPRTHTGKTDRVQLVAEVRRVAPVAGGLGAGDGRLREIWSRLLGHGDFSEASSFFDVGGDSLAAHDLVLELKDLMGRRVRLPEVYEFPTFSGQTRLIEGEGVGGDRLLRCWRSGESGRTVFLIPPYHGSTEVFRHFVVGLPEEVGVYGVEIGMVEVGDSDRPIERLAEAVVDCIGAVAPGGDVIVCGYSVGGLVAWEVGRRLRDAGGYAWRLWLLDAYRYFTRLEAAEARWVAGRRRRWTRVLYLGMLLLRPGVNSRRDLWVDFVVNRLRRRRFHEAVSSASSRLNGERQAELEMANQRIGLMYTVEPMGGEVVLVRARRQGLLINALAEDLGWRRFCRDGLEVCCIGCSHQELLGERTAGEVAGVLGGRLS